MSATRVTLRKTIKVRVTLTVEVAPDAWALAYGDTGRVDIRKAVVDYIHNQVIQSAAAEEGGIVSATLQ